MEKNQPAYVNRDGETVYYPPETKEIKASDLMKSMGIHVVHIG